MKLNLKFEVRWIRHLVQIVFFAIMIGIIFALKSTSSSLPFFEWLSMPLIAFGAIQLMLSSAVFPWLPLAVIVLIPILFNGFFCGWICPFGFVMDLLAYVKKRHTVFSLRTHNKLRRIKYLLLGFTFLISGSLAISLTTGNGQGYKEALGIFASAPYYVLSPDATLFVFIPEAIIRFSQPAPTPLMEAREGIWNVFATISPIPYIRVFLLTFAIIGALYVPRFWCRYFCPFGALISIFSRFSFLGLKRDITRCTKCKECVEKCPMAIRILDLEWEKFTDPDCTVCLYCRDVCERMAIRPIVS